MYCIYFAFQMCLAGRSGSAHSRRGRLPHPDGGIWAEVIRTACRDQTTALCNCNFIRRWRHIRKQSNRSGALVTYNTIKRPINSLLSPSSPMDGIFLISLFLVIGAPARLRVSLFSSWLQKLRFVEFLVLALKIYIPLSRLSFHPSFLMSVRSSGSHPSVLRRPSFIPPVRPSFCPSVKSVDPSLDQSNEPSVGPSVSPSGIYCITDKHIVWYYNLYHCIIIPHRRHINNIQRFLITVCSLVWNGLNSFLYSFCSKTKYQCIKLIRRQDTVVEINEGKVLRCRTR